ncbi:MAG: hypothetical protein ABSC63_11565 [Candidatus Binataceae bacterium]|jgi:hypothetical protein
MDFYEQVIEFYLTAIEGCAVLPQVNVTHSSSGEPWNACPDFLALDFGKKQVQIIEVSKKWDSPTRLALKWHADYRKNIEYFVRNSILRNHLEFELLWRFIVRGPNVEKLKSRSEYRDFIATGGKATVESIEMIFDSIKEKMP